MHTQGNHRMPRMPPYVRARLSFLAAPALRELDISFNSLEHHECHECHECHGTRMSCPFSPPSSSRKSARGPSAHRMDCMDCKDCRIASIASRTPRAMYVRWRMEVHAHAHTSAHRMHTSAHRMHIASIASIAYRSHSSSFFLNIVARCQPTCMGDRSCMCPPSRMSSAHPIPASIASNASNASIAPQISHCWHRPSSHRTLPTNLHGRQIRHVPPTIARMHVWVSFIQCPHIKPAVG